MALNYGFSFGCEGIPEAKEIGEHRFNRLNEWERTFFHGDPWMSLSFCLVMLSTDMRMVTDTSVLLIVDRLMMADNETAIWLCRKIATDLVREDDPKDFRELCKNYVDNPFDHRFFRRATHQQILRHWLLDRFGGVATNIATKSDAEWRKRLERSDVPKFDKSMHNVFFDERKALFEKFGRAPVTV